MKLFKNYILKIIMTFYKTYLLLTLGLIGNTLIKTVDEPKH